MIARFSLAAILSATVLSLPLSAQVTTASDTARLGGITVIGSSAEARETKQELARQPGGVSQVTMEKIRSSRQANLKDVLSSVPGVFVAPRFGAADESQISIRGSGLRNNFHTRGVNLLINGMPYRNADGFSDFESLEMMTTEAIQVYKGGNAFRYGGSTLGGAINFQTKTGYTAAPIDFTAQGGSHGFYKGQLSSGGEIGKIDYYASYARTSLDGYRDWSEQGRDRFNAHVGYALSEHLDARLFYVFAHVTEQLPGALTATELENTPAIAVASNKSDKWGRDYDLHHLGVQLRVQLATNQRLDVSPYYQYRDIDHPIFQVINQQSKDVGAEFRYENTGRLAGRANRLTVGFLPTRESMENHQYVNLVGKHGDLTKDQTDHAGGVAAWVENAASVGGKLTLVTGLKYDHQTRRSEDRFLSNGDQSDNRKFNTVLPRVGLILDRGTTQFFANATRSFEPPLLLELNSLAVPGFIQLKGQDSWQYEVGTRGSNERFGWEVSLYDAELSNELVNLNIQPFPNAPFTVPTYRNAAQTRHSGIEAGLRYKTGLHIASNDDALTLEGSWTMGRFRFVDDSSYTGNQIPGVPEHNITATARYAHPTGFTLAPSIEWAPGSYFVNSDNTVKNKGWFVVGARAELPIGSTGLSAFIMGQNLTDKRYAGSVQVDASNGRSFEPADRRSVYFGLHLVR